MVRIINEVVNTLKAFWFRFASVARGANLSKAHFQVCNFNNCITDRQSNKITRSCMLISKIFARLQCEITVKCVNFGERNNVRMAETKPVT